MAALGHRHIIRFYGAYEEKGRAYLVMERADGGDLFGTPAAMTHSSANTSPLSRPHTRTKTNQRTQCDPARTLAHTHAVACV